MKILLPRRILASTVDLLFYFISGLILPSFLNRLNIAVDDAIVLSILNLVVTLIIPIIVLKNTLGHYLFSVQYRPEQWLRLRLSVKYLAYFFIIANASDGVYSLLRDALSRYTIINLPYTLSLRISLTVCIVSLSTFIITAGKTNLLDLFLNLEILGAPIKRRRIIKLDMYLLVYFFLLTGVFEFEAKKYFNYERVIYTIRNAVNTNYFPIEVFGDYLDQSNSFVAQKDENTGDIISMSRVSSFIQSNYLSRRTISVIINEKTKNSIYLRKMLVYKLLKYGVFSLSHEGKYVDQIKFQLFYYKTSYLYMYKYIYTYYYDVKMPSLLVHGGPEKEQLMNYYHLFDSAIIGQKIGALSQALNLSPGQFKKYLQKDGSFKPPDSILRKIKNGITVKYTIKPPEFNVKLISFDKVKPIVGLWIPYPLTQAQMVDIYNTIDSDKELYTERDRSLIKWYKNITN
jgi:hypothetical protein